MSVCNIVHKVVESARMAEGQKRRGAGNISSETEMKSSAADRTTREAPDASALKRRGLLLGAGAAGAAVIAAQALPTAPTEVAAAPAKPPRDDKAGYQLTQHVLRYYETTKV